MSRVRSLWLVLLIALFEFDAALSATPKMCDFEDMECFRRGAQKSYKAVVAGVKGLSDPIDPMFIERIQGEFSTFKYQLTNVTLTGLRNCEAIYLKFYKDDATYLLKLHCPQLVFEFHYVLSGVLADTEYDGEGEMSVTIEDYLIIITGKIQKFISEKDHKPYFTLKEYDIDTELKGKLVLEVKKNIKGDKIKVDQLVTYFNNNIKAFEKYLRSVTLDKFLKLFMKTYEKYSTTVPIYEIYSQD